jgi:nucleoside-diphosphate-sugar epimerase
MRLLGDGFEVIGLDNLMTGDFVSLGYSPELTMIDLAEATMRVAGKRVQPVRQPLPKDDPRRLLGFEPKTALEVGSKRTDDDFQVRLAARAVAS